PVTFGISEKGRAQGLPKGYKRTTMERRSTLIQYNGQQAKALLLGNDPSVVVRPPTDEDQPLSTREERFCKAAYSRFEELTHAHEKLADTQVHYYMGILKTHPLRTPYPDMPKIEDNADDDELLAWNTRTEEWKKNRSVADVFEYVFVQPETYMRIKDSRGLVCAVEVKMVPEADMMEEFGLIRDDTENEYLVAEGGTPVGESDPLRTVEVIEYWNRQYRAVIIKGGPKGGSVVDIWEHGFGRVPYFEFTAFETGELDPEFEQVPLLWPLYPEVEDNNRLQTLRTNVAYHGAFPDEYIFTAPEGDLVLDEKTGKPRVYHVVPGEAEQLNPGQEWRRIDMQSGFDLQSALKDSDARIAELALPPIASGRAPAGESPAWGTQLLRRYLVSLLDPLVRGRAMATAEYMRFWLWCIQNIIGQTVWVNADVLDGSGKVIGKEPLSLAPNEVVSLDIAVNIQPNIQNERMAQESHGSQMVAAGLRAVQTFLEEDAGRDAPEEEMRRIDIDFAKAQIRPVMLAKLEELFKNSGMMDAVAQGTQPEAAYEQVVDDVQGMGTGSPGQAREPGLGMAPSLPMEESSTYSPPGLEGAPIPPPAPEVGPIV
ncbi:MAG TPA: hypothetical protein VNA25_30840, partial [Phycisphaerae bacterium]|nr:hypothetical protein [Phycisphaerae bacterium]